MELLIAKVIIFAVLGGLWWYVSNKREESKLPNKEGE